MQSRTQTYRHPILPSTVQFHHENLRNMIIFVILLPLAVTFFITWWFIQKVDGVFSPIYRHLGLNFFGLGFMTSITFIFLVGVFMSSWLGASVLQLGPWHEIQGNKYLKARVIVPDQNSHAFKEVAIIKHPRVGEYALAFITSTSNLGEEELYSVYVPTNHLYLGDIFLVSSREIMTPNLSVREGIEIVISGGISIPQILTTVDAQVLRSNRSGDFGGVSV
ncbi:hypothetical protein Cgig2_007275 [Carnegiea gigantea]|uniref:DUF502 domain-containing protein n=1 Tax=Carnegiea gigantea TaxID=171969 RepID=A0A9Q1KY21_9CARY|nr:hypothetical protein Cgig2_007275 [Carnegiea gigantea]